MTIIMPMASNSAARPPAHEDLDLRTRSGATFVVLTGIYAASFLLPLPETDGKIAHLPSICPFYTVTGLPCPGCGLTRAFVCIAHGRFLESVHWHALGGLLFALGLVLWGCAGMSWVRNAPVVRLSPWAMTWLSRGLLAGLLLFGIGRIALIVSGRFAF